MVVNDSKPSTNWKSASKDSKSTTTNPKGWGSTSTKSAHPSNNTNHNSVSHHDHKPGSIQPKAPHYHFSSVYKDYNYYLHPNDRYTDHSSTRNRGYNINRDSSSFSRHNNNSNYRQYDNDNRDTHHQGYNIEIVS